MVCCIFLTSWVREPKKSNREISLAGAAQRSFGLADKIDARTVINFGGSDMGSDLSNMTYIRR